MAIAWRVAIVVWPIEYCMTSDGLASRPVEPDAARYAVASAASACWSPVIARYTALSASVSVIAGSGGSVAPTVKSS